VIEVAPAHRGRQLRPAGREGITNQWGIEDPAWMVRSELAPGEVRFPAAFG
jgi:hypothetical protein